jgi:hypothetical protein
VRQWFQSLKQPDHPRLSCCGEADAFEADSFEVEGASGLGTRFDSLNPRGCRGAKFRRGEDCATALNLHPQGRAKRGIERMKIVMVIIKPFQLDAVRDALTVTSMATVLMMTIPGLALFCGGLVHRKNVGDTVMTSFAITCLIRILSLFFT